MTYERLYEAAVDCAREARVMATRGSTDMATAWSRAGELFLKLAEHKMGVDMMKPKPPPPPPGRPAPRDTLDY